ncbi:MAG: hypothetical protein J7J92_01380 [Candidatus Aenigmarchaeota archaeon]|nr:hypothetical protein [Candidatus Aenigmarchaeota archaeon]
MVARKLTEKLKEKLGFIKDEKLKEEVVKEIEGNKKTPQPATKDKKDEIEIDIGGLKRIEKRSVNFIKKRWPLLLIITIILLGFYIRIVGFHYPYLRNIDSYYFYRYMNFVVKDGHIPAIDPYMTAPEGLPTSGLRRLYIYLGAYSYMFTRLFKPDLQLWRFLIYFPALLASLAAIPMYYIGKSLMDRKAGVIAAFLFIFNPFNMTRTLGGDPDSDCIVLLMTLVPIALFLATQKTLKNGWHKNSIIYSLLTGIGLALFAHTWSGSWYVPWLFAGFVFIKIVIDLVHTKNLSRTMQTAKPLLFSFLTIVLVFFLLTVPFFGIRYPIGIVRGPFCASQYKSEAHIRFPNVWVSIAEMTAPDGSGILQKMSTVALRLNPYMFILSVTSLLYLGLSFFKKGKHKDTFILLFIWFIGSLAASIFAVRFIVLLSTPVVIAASILIAKLFRVAIGEDKEILD